MGDARSNASYLCFDPIRVLRYRQDDFSTVDPLEVLRREIGQHPPVDAPLPFSGGAIGFFSYELGRALEHIPTRHGDTQNLPDMVAGIYDTVIGFDHRTEQAWLMLRERPGCCFDARAERIRGRLLRPATRSTLPALAWHPDFDRDAYLAKVACVLEWIRAGDIFQANLTLRHWAKRPPGLDLAAVYLALRKASPAPFGAYLDCGEGLALLSASPERFLSLDAAGQIEARPIKGTRPRDVDPVRDQAFAEALAGSTKDRAENLMITDLLRHDIGRVAELGSIAVPEFCRVEHFAGAHHLVSSITGKLRPRLDAIDLLRATLPGGSVTGAPKIRAMQIIDAVEPCRRGAYCGAIAWIGFDGAMDSSIVIRTLIATPDKLFAQAGGGIVADSEPAAEYAEMMVKAAPMLEICNV